MTNEGKSFDNPTAELMFEITTKLTTTIVDLIEHVDVLIKGEHRSIWETYRANARKSLEETEAALLKELQRRREEAAREDNAMVMAARDSGLTPNLHGRLLDGLEKGSIFDPDTILSCVGEQLSEEERNDARAFLSWIAETKQSFGRANICKRWVEYMSTVGIGGG